MIKEIYCKKFKKQRVSFKPGLNVILGDMNGSNSIGKSSMLLAVDFMLGGSTYSRCEDIINNIGHHEIGACFEFCNKRHYFLRSTKFSQTVYKCDENYDKTESKEISLEEYKNFLQEKYGIDLFQSSFRLIVGLFSRIYGRENCDETNPLKSFPNEKVGDSIKNLTKIFNRYKEIEELDLTRKELSEKYAVYDKASKYNLIKTPNSQKELKEIEKKITSLQQSIQSVESELETGTVNLNTEQLQKVLNVKECLYRIQESKSFLKSKISRYKNNIEGLNAQNILDISLVKKFFPNSNILEIEKINIFHKELLNIIQNDLSVQIEQLEKRYEQLEQDEKKILDELAFSMEEENPSKLAVKSLLSMNKEMLSLIDSSAGYENRKRYRLEKQEAEDLFKISFQKVLNEIQQIINSQITVYCDEIYSKTKKSPLITLQPKNYSYDCPDDSGTGFKYCSLIMFDLAILRATALPILIHDSLLFKNIENEAIEHLLQIYEKYPGKQIFIAFDKSDSYSSKTRSVLDKNAVLRLSPHGNELFGRSWNRKSN